MIKLKDEEKTDFEQDLYEARVEEALAKWEAAKPSETSQKREISSPEEGWDKEE
jgi:hypothetical protein